MENEDVRINWSDCKKYIKLFNITYRRMYVKFYPHFVQREEDVKQEMLIELIKIVKRIKKGHVKVSERNFVITGLKYKCYKIARKYIDEDKSKCYLEDIKLSNMGYELTWEDLIPSSLVTFENIFSDFTEFEEQYMVLIIIREQGYTRRKLRGILKVSWEHMSELEHRVKERIKDNILRRTENAEAYFKKG